MAAKNKRIKQIGCCVLQYFFLQSLKVQKYYFSYFNFKLLFIPYQKMQET